MLIVQGVPPLSGVKQWWGGVGKQAILCVCQYLENCIGDTSKLLFMTNRKLHMRFRLTSNSMTLDDLELYKFEFSENFSRIRRFRAQQQLNE